MSSAAIGAGARPAPPWPREAAVLAGAEVRAAARRPWLLAVALLGVLLAGVAGAVAATHAGGLREDSLRSSGAGIMFIGGLVVALGLGATALNRDAGSGFLGLLVASGARRARIAAARMAVRIALLVATLAVWTLALEIASLALGLGLDGPLALHAAAAAETSALVLLVACLASAGFGPTVAAVSGLVVLVAAQSVVNLQAAGDQFLLGSPARQAVSAAYYVLPRSIISPMIADLQNRGQGGIAGPRLDINETVVHMTGSSALTVLWTLLWCGIFAGLALAAIRRRAL